MAEIIFIYEGINTIIQCENNDKMKDIIDKFLIKIENKENNLYYLYNGTKINYELTFNEQANDIDKNRKKMNIIVNKNEEDNNIIKEMISKEIVCPWCKQNILTDFVNFKINFHDCISNHNINIALNEFEKTQKINLNNIICNICKINNKGNTHNNEFYICNTCNKNVCPLCKSNHDKNHKIINYDDKNYICKKHNESFIKYCTTCKVDMCIICDDEHRGHSISDFRKILIKNDDLLNSLKELNNVIDNFKYKYDIIKEIFDRLINTFDLYYKINKNIINNYNINKRNYYILQNLCNLKNNNEIIIKYINNVINNNQIFDIYKFPNEYVYNDNEGIYIGELKNTYIKWIKEGKGIYYYNKDDPNKRKKYEGDWKDDKRNGKGIFYWNNGGKYIGDWKNNKREGKGIIHFTNGDRYEGDWKNSVFDGKGIYYCKNGDRYEGNWKNNLREGKGILFVNDGSRYEGDWKKDLMDGEGMYFWKDGRKYVGDWKNGIKEGKGILYYNNGDRYEGDWKNDNREGNGIMFYNNGKIEEGIWKNDQLVTN